MQVVQPDMKLKLEHLITDTIDGEKAYEKAAELIATKDPALAGTFRDCAVQRAQFATQLQSTVAPYGVFVNTESSLKADLQRGWMVLREAINIEDQKILLAEVTKAEKAGLAHFQALLDEPLPDDIRPLVAQQWVQLQESLNHWEQLYAQT